MRDAFFWLAARSAHVLACVTVDFARRGQPRLTNLRGLKRASLGGAAQRVGTATDSLSGLLEGEHLIRANLHMCIVSGTKAVENVPYIVYIHWHWRCNATLKERTGCGTKP